MAFTSMRAALQQILDLRHMPPHRAARRVWQALARRWWARREIRHDARHPTASRAVTDVQLEKILHLDVKALTPRQWEDLQQAAQMACAHRFSFLGSTLVEVRHGLQAAGCLGHVHPPAPAVVADADGDWLKCRVTAANLPHSQAIWRLIATGPYARPDYQPIDWQIDFKSGYRWSETTQWRLIRIGPAPGADIKMPWELARMPYLPQLALYSAACRARGDQVESHRAATEVRAIMLDFLATNPVRYGVNWRSPMEVAIRIANMLVAASILAAAGHGFDPAFQAALRDAAFDHARHILANLEWSEDHRGNHYMADLCGVFFVAAFFSRTAETDAWLAFTVAELDAEIRRQFLADGGSFEQSSSYHRLSGEMALWVSAALLGLPQARLSAFTAFERRQLKVRPPVPAAPLPLGLEGLPFSATTIARLHRLAEFSRDITKPDQTIVQIGDNDSGRFLRLDPYLNRIAGRTRDPIDHAGLLAMASITLGRHDIAPSEPQADALLAQALIGSPQATRATGEPPFPSRRLRHGLPSALAAALARAAAAPADRRAEHFFAFDAPIGRPNLAAYPDFGLYVFQAPGFFLSVRCARQVSDVSEGHSHDDNLAVELIIHGKNLICDAGTLVYTADPASRRRYRAAAAHFVPRDALGGPPIETENLFEFFHISSALCLFFGEEGFVGRLSGAGQDVTRLVVLEPHGIRIIDAADHGPLRTGGTGNDIPVCEGYGQQTQRSVCDF